MREWHKMSISDVSLELGTDTKAGKTNVNSDRKRKHANTVIRIPLIDPSAIIRTMASDVSLLLLSVTYLIAIFADHLHESLVGISLSALVFAVGCYIKYRSGKRINNAYYLLLPSIKVTENGKKIRLSVFDVEVGDLINFSRGDIIPADARLVSSSSLRVAERRISEISGKLEYVNFDKDVDAVFDDEKKLYSNFVFAGSMVVSGSGSAIVTAIGEDTVSSQSGAHISIAPDIDMPGYLSKFNKEAKLISLSVLAAVIPLSLFGLYRQTLYEGSEQADLLYSFALSLALAVTCMSYLVTFPAESIVTKEILPSSRFKISKKTTESRITKFSAAEKLAEIDTILILSPELLIDNKTLVRTAFFAGESFRFDSLRSEYLSDFACEIAPYYVHTSANKCNASEAAVMGFIEQFDIGPSSMNISGIKPTYLRDTSNGTRICVFEKDAHNSPVKFIARTSNPAIINECSHFRNEGGSIWKCDRSLLEKVDKWYKHNIDSGRKIFIFVSSDGQDSPSVFEGMLAVGEEYPYNDGFSVLFDESAISPILVLEQENKKNIDIARKCGIVKNESDIAIASQYAESGLGITDAPISIKAYVGFGKQGTSDLIERLVKYGKDILPIIRDSTNRQNISPESLYAVHDSESFDSVKIGASVTLTPADTATKSGGLIDVFNIIKRSSMAYLKLGVYRNYLLLSLFMRAFAVCLPLLIGNPALVMTSVMILFSGFLTDYAALFGIMCAGGLPVRPSDTAEEAGKLFSHSLIYVYAFSALISSGAAVLISNRLITSGMLAVSAAPWFIMYSLIFADLLSLGAFLIILMKRARRFSFNYVFIAEVLLFAAWMYMQSGISHEWILKFSEFGFDVINIAQVPFMLISGVLSFVFVLVIGRILSVGTPIRK